MCHILESCFFSPSCLPKSLWEDGMAYQGVSMAIRGNVSGSQEFRPGKVLTDKQNEKVSSLASAIPSLFPLLSHLLTPAILSSVFSCSPPILHFFQVQNLLNTYPSYLYLRLQMASLSSTIILHLLNFFSLVAIMLYF